jgi:hypothetical protein
LKEHHCLNNIDEDWCSMGAYPGFNIPKKVLLPCQPMAGKGHAKSWSNNFACLYGSPEDTHKGAKNPF